jgi:hypothetical protein
MKVKAQIIIGLVSLACLLAYTWVHTGALLASYVEPHAVGFVAAAGIELAIVGLSLRVNELRKSSLGARFFVFTLIAVVIVSALANVSEGFAVKFHEPLTVSNVGKLDIVQAVVSVAATALISLVTLALAEIVGQDVNAAVKVSSRIAKPSAVTAPAVTTEVSDTASTTDAVNTLTPTLEQARSVKANQDTQQKAAALDTLIEHLTSDPDVTVTELARLIGKSRTTVYAYLDELEASGKIHRNGQATVLDSVPAN